MPDGGASSGGSASDGPAGAGGAALRLLREALADPEFLNYRPSGVWLLLAVASRHLGFC